MHDHQKPCLKKLKANSGSLARKTLRTQKGIRILPDFMASVPSCRRQPCINRLYLHLKSGQKLEDGQNGTTTVALAFWILKKMHSSSD